MSANADGAAATAAGRAVRVRDFASCLLIRAAPGRPGESLLLVTDSRGLADFEGACALLLCGYCNDSCILCSAY